MQWYLVRIDDITALRVGACHFLPPPHVSFWITCIRLNAIGKLKVGHERDTISI